MACAMSVRPEGGNLRLAQGTPWVCQLFFYDYYMTASRSWFSERVEVKYLRSTRPLTLERIKSLLKVFIPHKYFVFLPDK